MTVLSPSDPKQALAGFVPKGRYSYLDLLMQFAADWNADLPEVQARIAKLRSDADFAQLFRDIITADRIGSRWVAHPNARILLWVSFQALSTAWVNVLRHAPDCQQLTLEYLADALAAFKQATRTA
jgi:hypothetical protein